MTKELVTPVKQLSATTLKRRANKIKRELAEKNAKFMKMSKQRRRIAIAKDALEQIMLNKYLTTRALYFTVKNARKYKNDCQVNQALAEGAQCYVCAKGALFASKVSFTNNLKIGEVKRSTQIKSDDTKEKVNDFSAFQMDMIELAYEGYDPSGNDISWGSEEYASAIDFYSKYPKRRARLIAILQNIIENKGEFKP